MYSLCVKTQITPNHPWTLHYGDDAKHILLKLDIEALGKLNRSENSSVFSSVDIRTLNDKTLLSGTVVKVSSLDPDFVSDILKKRKSVRDPKKSKSSKKKS